MGNGTTDFTFVHSKTTTEVDKTSGLVGGARIGQLKVYFLNQDGICLLCITQVIGEYLLDIIGLTNGSGGIFILGLLNC